MSIRFLAVLILATLPAAASADEAQVTFEVRYVMVPAGVQLINAPSKEGETTNLTDAQLKSLLETVQGLRHSNVTQTPKVIAIHDQATGVKALEQRTFVSTLEATIVRGESVLVPKSTTVELGTVLNLRGRIAADKSTVAVDLKYAEKRVDKVNLVPVTSQIIPTYEGGSQGKPETSTQYLQAPQITNVIFEKKELSIASGEHVVVAGPTIQMEFREESRVPLLSDLPVAGRMFRSVGVAKVKVKTMLIVSAKVVETAN